MSISRRRLRTAFLAALLLLPTGAAQARDTLRLERTVMLMRHGVRTPLDGEVPDGTRTSAAWPRWPSAPSLLTDHGAQAMAIVGGFDRSRFLPARGCPKVAAVRIWTNTAPRTIASGEAWARGFAPGCALTVGHLPGEAVDPLFEPLRAGATAFDASAAVAAITAYTGGVEALARRHASTIAQLDRVLGCGLPDGCSPAAASRLTPSADGRGIDLTGPIRITSGTAQVLLLAYAQGLPRAQVGWGRADAATIRQLGTLHAALFDVFSRSPYMASHQAAVFGRHMLDALTAPRGPAIDVLVGHDTNVTALAAALGVDLVAPGYATNDAAPGGALILERLRGAGQARFVRLSYRTQSPDALRTLSPAVTLTPIRIPGCASPCPIDRFATILRARLAPLATR